MTFIERIIAVVEDIRDKFNVVTPRLIPEGGVQGECLVKNSEEDNDVSWKPQKIFIQEQQPTSQDPFIWVQTNVGNDPESMTVWIEDGDHV